MAGQGAGAFDCQNSHLAVQHSKRRGVGAVRDAQLEALPVQPEGEGGDDAAHGHATNLGKEHGPGRCKRQPAGLEILQHRGTRSAVHPTRGLHDSELCDEWP